ncbi:hypothetical protein P5V15_015777 [Pogonomyrmex californicus]
MIKNILRLKTKKTVPIIGMWVRNIDEEVNILLIDNEGDRENAHYMPKFAEYLIKDIKLLLLWSCVCRDKFGFGRVPASSASVESDFNIIKHILLKTEKTSMPADEFVEKHIKFLNGRLKIVQANKNIPTDNPTDTNMEMDINIEQSVPTNQNEITNNVGIEKRCPACANGHQPIGGHRCYVYQKYVHTLDECSKSVGEEGYGQQRICVDCQNINNLPDIVATRETKD